MIKDSHCSSDVTVLIGDKGATVKTGKKKEKAENKKLNNKKMESFCRPSTIFLSGRDNVEIKFSLEAEKQKMQQKYCNIRMCIV